MKKMLLMITLIVPMITGISLLMNYPSTAQAKSPGDVTTIYVYLNFEGDIVGLSDLNADGRVDSLDYDLFLGALGKCAESGFIALADYNGDGCVSYADYRIWHGYYRGQ